ncbi:phosphate acyltransferase [uncultured Aliiroseovarius sp.]|uniref:phosphate acyltransferase n=1 Tax=uncultured Aliiroseovarius sp. TaxID=1658783 RepID=UPI00259A83F5|nr:phosphate acyltransferase [uncultured Aliiroseovarius sp.]
MTFVRSFDALRERVAELPPARLAVAGGDDPAVIKAVVAALKANMISRAIISGAKPTIEASLPDAARRNVDIIEADNPADCATEAVRAVREGAANILMKGHVDSTSYLRAVVNRETGIRKGGVLSNVTVAAMKSYPKLLVATDNGIVPQPDLDQKRQIILNTRDLFQGLGIDTVKTAAVAATEKVSQALPATLDARTLTEESAAGLLPGFVVEGPFGYDVAVSKASADKKGLSESVVAGEADLIVFPTIDAANAVAKAWKFHGDAETGSIVLGARVPVLLNSRSDGVARRLNALMLAIVAGSVGKGEENAA